MRRTITTLTALVAAASLAACSPETETETTAEETSVAEETTEASTSEAAPETAATTDDAGATDEAAGTADAVCTEFFETQGIPVAERATTTRDLLETGDPLDPVSYSDLSLLQSRIEMMGEEASSDQAALLERVNAPFTEVVDAVVAEDARMEDEITIPEVDVADSQAAQDELESACAG